MNAEITSPRKQERRERFSSKDQIEKPFDAVRLMRSIRERISKEIGGMTFEEQQEYIRARLPAETVAHFIADRKCRREKARAPKPSDDLTPGV